MASANQKNKTNPREFALADVASAKKLPLDWLQNYCDLRDLGNGVIGIPYCDDAGNELFVRKRNPPGTEPRFLQPKGTKLVPYGLNRLDIAHRDEPAHSRFPRLTRFLTPEERYCTHRPRRK
ncbi:MAG: hypothetical protein ACYC3I_09005 [Gemmataceae bacterium]